MAFPVEDQKMFAGGIADKLGKMGGLDNVNVGGVRLGPDLEL